MSNKLPSGFLRGRPFVGLAFLLRISVIVECILVGVAPNCRCLTVMIRLHTGLKLLPFDVYLPYYESSYAYQDEMHECIGFIENCILCNDCDNIILLGDFNFKCRPNNQSTGYNMIKPLLNDYDLGRCNILDSLHK